MSFKYMLNKPNFYIKYGPPASGKSSVMNKILNIDKGNNRMVTIDVDKIINMDKKYIAIRDQISQSKNLKAMSNLYWFWRKKADLISDSILNKALLNRLDISWETTGNNIDWALKEIKRIKKLNYNIIIIYPLVPLKKLIERSNLRFKKNCQLSPSAKEIKLMSENATKNLKDIIKYSDELLIYDNSGKKNEHKLIVSLNLKNNKIFCSCNEIKHNKFSEGIIDLLKEICSSKCS